MKRISAFVLSAAFAAGVFATGASWAVAQMQNFKSVTDEMLRNPSPNDWLMYSRTYDAFRDSPLAQINTKNVKNLRMAWVRGLEAGTTETIPLVHDGVMYVIAPGGFVDALDATNGDLIWEYKRPFKNPRLGFERADQGAGDLQGHGLFHRGGRVRDRAGRAHGQSPVGNFQDRHAEYVRRAGRGRQGDFGRHVRQGQRQLFHRSGQRRHGREDLAIFHRGASGRSGIRVVGRVGQLAVNGVDVGTAGQFRSRSQRAVLGRRESDAGSTHGAAQRRSRRYFAVDARRPLQQFHAGARSRHGQAHLVLPAPAGRRLGHRPHARAHARARGFQSESEIRQVDQSDRSARIGARHRGDGGGGRDCVRAGPQQRAVPVGHAVSVRRPELHNVRHRREDRDRRR